MRNTRSEEVKVSIIVVSRNARDTIGRCLDSIMSQTYLDVEIVVVDSSDDGTEKIIEDYARNSRPPFKIIRQNPKGVGAARNEGLRNACGEVIVWVDTDCYIPPEFVEKITEPFERSEKVMGVLARNVIKTQEQTFFSDLVRLYEEVMLGIPHSYIGLVAIRKGFSDKIGGFKENLEVGEDFVYWKNLEKIRKGLEREGFEFLPVDTYIIEEKKAQTFIKYWKKCMWYGEAFTNMNYLKSDAKNIVKLISSLYLFSLPLLLIIQSIIQSGINFSIMKILFPFIGFSIYLYYKIFISKKIYSSKGLFIPLILYYKGFWTTIGFLKKIFKNFIKNFLI
jgi:glycosyltransferase involved in cell wall biosynthesis